MKSLLVLALCAAPAVAQTMAPTSAPKFDWKLRLTKGQTWTQTLRTSVRSNTDTTGPQAKAPTRMDSDITQSASVKNEVLDATPAFYLIRSTYTAFKQSVSVKVNGKTAPGSAMKMPDLSQAFVGASFTIKQAPDGRVLDITGLEDLMARQNKVMNTLFKTPAERASFKQFMPSIATYKAALSKSQSAALPPAPLAIGQSYSYSVSLPVPFAVATQVKGRRTLRSFDAQGAVFDDNAMFSIAPLQISGAQADTVVLTRDAAQMYLYAQAKKDVGRKYHQAVQFYLSKNGGIYYREPNTHQAVFVAMPSQSRVLRVSRKAATPFKNIIGYNNRDRGDSLDYFFYGANEPHHNLSAENDEPVALPAQPKTFMTMSGAISGQSLIDAQTGLSHSSSVTTKVLGKVTSIQADGTRITVPINATSQIIVSTTTP